MATVEVIPNGELEFSDAKTENGRLSGKPIFYGNGRDEASILTLVVKSEKGEILRRYLICLDGLTSKVLLKERSAPTLGAFEQPPELVKNTEKPKTSRSAPSLVG
jgi:hypothetical protein